MAHYDKKDDKNHRKRIRNTPIVIKVHLNDHKLTMNL